MICYNNGPEVAFQYFYICGTVKRINTILDWLFSRQTKNKTITKSNRSRRKTKAVNKFKPIYYFSIIIKSDKHICLLNLPKLFVDTLGKSDSLSKKDTKMYCRNIVVNAAGKIHNSKWFWASLNDTDKLVSKKTVHYVNEKLALVPLNVDHVRFQDQVYLK